MTTVKITDGKGKTRVFETVSNPGQLTEEQQGRLLRVGRGNAQALALEITPKKPNLFQRILRKRKEG